MSDPKQETQGGLDAELQRLGDERRTLENQVAQARAEVARVQAEKLRLQRQLNEIEEEARRVAERYQEAQQQNSDLTQLTVASQRLHESLDRSEVLAAIQEIVINLLGSEELGVFEVTDDGKTLRLVNSFGIEEERYRNIPLGLGSIGTAALANAPVLAEGKAAEEGLTVCVPLMAGEKLVGVVAVFRLLPQKGRLELADRELLDLLRAQGGVALYCTRLQQRPAGSAGGAEAR
jgi:nitrate/nitrite-specific signal transduction histidine kinase